MKNYYEVLGISKNSSNTDIKKAAKEKIDQIKIIFATLVNSEQHKNYDIKLSNTSSTARNYYEIIEVNIDASPNEIKNNAKIKINEIKTAFNILSDYKQRKQYDLELDSATIPKLIITNDDILSTPHDFPQTPNLETDKCSTCNAVIYQKAEFCHKCGIRHRRPAKKLTLLLLTLFTGGFGIHRFYLGNYLWGTIYLLFFWTFIPVLISLIEYVIFLFKSSDKIEESYEAHESTVAIVMILPVLLFFGRITLPIMIPAYWDYASKTKVVEAILLLENSKLIVEKHIQKTGTFPSTNELKAIGIITSGTYVSDIESNVQQNYLQATMNNNASVVTGKTIRITYENPNDWKCGPGFPNGINSDYLPYNCR
ncbi:MAG TPA: NINE protein [Thioploca sp.]|nr:NINE protein [Thioploca sp.]